MYMFKYILKRLGLMIFNHYYNVFCPHQVTTYCD